MSVTFEKKVVSDSLIELTVTVPPEDMEKYINQAAVDLSKHIDLKGFRPGKAPRKVVESRFGVGALFQEAVNLALPKTYSDIILDEKIESLGQPEIDVKKAAHGNDFVYVAKVYVVPEITLPKYDSIKVKKEEVKTTKKEVDEALEELRKSRAKSVVVDRAAKKDDQVMVNFETFLGKVPVENGKSENHPVVIGEGKFIPGFEDEIVGLKKGDKKEFDLVFPKDYHAKHLADKKVHFKVDVIDVSERTLPKLDDAFAKDMGDFKTIDDLRKKMEENITHEKEHKESDRLEGEMLDALSAKVKVSLPENLIEQEKKKMLDEFRHMIESQGGDFSQYMETQKTDEKKLLKGFQKDAEKRVRASLVLRKVAEVEKIEVPSEEIEKELEVQKMQYSFNPDVVKRIESDEYFEYMRNILKNRKSIEFLKKKIIK